MELTITQPCPSCGAEIRINENSRLIRCEFCEVKNYRIHQRLPRYVLPAKLPPHIDYSQLLYVPYLRFKGSIYFCQGDRVRHKLIDTTRVGHSIQHLPISLGLRPQAMAIAPVTEQLQGRFVPQDVKGETILTEAAKLTTLFDKDKKSIVQHRAFIGETVSRIYLPIYESKGRMIDGITHNQLGNASSNPKTKRMLDFDKNWEPRFLSTICPGCGDDLQGEMNSLVLHCENCNATWLEEKGRFVRVKHQVMPTNSRDVQYLPFWHLHVEGSEGRGISLSSFADFIQLTNQPVVVNARHREHALAFLIPAFKLNPEAFLHTARNVTLLQHSLPQSSATLKVKNGLRYPATLPYSEAIQALKTVIAASAVNARRIMQLLPGLQFSVKGIYLQYIPFKPSCHDWIEENTGFSISSAALRFGRGM